MDEDLERTIRQGIKSCDDMTRFADVCLSESHEIPNKGSRKMATLETTIKARITQAVKEKDNVARDVLRLTVGEFERLQLRSDGKDEDWINLIKKMIKSIDTCLESAGDTRQELSTQWLKEKQVLSEFLPKAMTQDQLKAFIVDNSIVVSKELGEGRSVGNVMKVLKLSGQEFNNADVKSVVTELISS